MEALACIKHDGEIVNRLSNLGLTRQELIRVVSKAVAARNDAVDMDPLNAPGLLAYIYGTRALREELCLKGWIKDRTNNVEFTVNPLTGVKLIYQNVDSASKVSYTPRPLSKKGSATSQMVNDRQLSLPFMEEPELAECNPLIWFLCVSVSDSGKVRAELSCPAMINDGQFAQFYERIFIITDDDNIYSDNLLFTSDDVESDEIEINISRK